MEQNNVFSALAGDSNLFRINIDTVTDNGENHKSVKIYKYSPNTNAVELVKGNLTKKDESAFKEPSFTYKLINMTNTIYENINKRDKNILIYDVAFNELIGGLFDRS